MDVYDPGDPEERDKADRIFFGVLFTILTLAGAISIFLVVALKEIEADLDEYHVEAAKATKACL